MSLPLLTRDKIASFLPTPELQRAYEALQRGASGSMDAVVVAQAAADAAQAAADAAQAAANAAQAAADAAQAAADAAQSDANTAQASANVAQADIDAHEALTAAHGATGAVVGTTNSQTLSNKTLDGATPLTSRTVTTGAAVAALTANKPGATTAIVGWLAVSVNGSNRLIPLWDAA